MLRKQMGSYHVEELARRDVSMTSRSGSILCIQRLRAGQVLLLPFSCTGRPDDCFNPARGHGAGALSLGFFTQNTEDVGFRHGEFHVIPDAQQDGPRRTAFLNYQLPALVLNALHQLAETGAGSKTAETTNVSLLPGWQISSSPVRLCLDNFR